MEDDNTNQQAEKDVNEKEQVMDKNYDITKGNLFIFIYYFLYD